MYYFHAFGLSIRSTLKFPELTPTAAVASVEVEIEAGIITDETSRLDSYFFQHPSVGKFRIERGTRIIYESKADVEESDLRLFLLGSGLGCILQQRGHIVLHGNAIAMDSDHCRIVVGHRGAGKSTAAAWHYLQGHQILADDVCAIGFGADGHPYVVPSYPQIKLWQSSVDLLGLSSEGLRRIRKADEKFGLALGDRFQSRPLRLTEVMELDQTQPAEIAICGSDKLKVLVEHTYRYPFLRKMGRLPEYHKKLIQLAPHVRVTKSPRRNLANVPTTV